MTHDPLSNNDLVPEVLPASRRKLWHVATCLVAVAAVSGATGAVAGSLLMKPLPSPMTWTAPTDTPPAESTAMVALPAAESPVELVGNKTLFAFERGGKTYVQLQHVGHDPSAVLPAFHNLRHVDGDQHNIGTAVADLKTSDLAPSIGSWVGQRVVVDGSCQAEVSGLVLMGLATGDFGYMASSDDALNTQERRAREILQHGNRIIAGELDGCVVSSGIARRADLPAALVGFEIDRPELVRNAKRLLLKSAAAVKVQRQFAAAEGSQGTWWKNRDVQVAGTVNRHPMTGETIVSVHVWLDAECGGPNGNVWGQYRVVGQSKLEEISAVELEGVSDIQTAVDTDGDGTFEFRARRYLDGDVLIDSTGATLDDLTVPFFGCPC